MDTDEERLLTSAEVCEALGIERSTLSRWVASGRVVAAAKGPGIRGPFFFAPAEVERALSLRTDDVSA